MGIPVVTVSYRHSGVADEQAPGEAEAQCVELAKAGKVATRPQ